MYNHQDPQIFWPIDTSNAPFTLKIELHTNSAEIIDIFLYQDITTELDQTGDGMI